MTQKKPSWLKYIIAAVILALFITAALVFILFTQEQSSDPASEKIIREIAAKQLNKEPNDLTDNDFAKITKFAIRSQELTDIKLLEKFINLQNLTLNNIKFPSRQIPIWMNILVKIGIYDLNEKFLLDLRPLKNLSSLQELSISGSKVSNLEPIKGCLNLQILYIDRTLICDLKPISEMTRLKELYLNETKVSNLELIKKLTNMEMLNIRLTQVSDLEPIKGLTKLNFLDLSETQVSDLEPINGLTKLSKLFLRKTQVSDLKPLRGLTNLSLLDLRNCNNIKDEQVEDLQKALPNLTIKR